MMEIEEFLMDRLKDTMLMIEEMPPHMQHTAKIGVDMLRSMIDWHENWPVLVESEPKFEEDYDPVLGDNIQIRMTNRIAWLTQQEYINKFGTQPPTAPLLREMASQYSDHPDFDEAWRI